MSLSPSPHPSSATPLRSDVTIVEVAGEAAGLAIRDRGGLRFFAAARPFHALEGRLFSSLKAIHAAARELAPGRRPAPRRAA